MTKVIFILSIAAISKLVIRIQSPESAHLDVTIFYDYCVSRRYHVDVLERRLGGLRQSSEVTGNIILVHLRLHSRDVNQLFEIGGPYRAPMSYVVIEIAASRSHHAPRSTIATMDP